jgi:flagellar hook protein FlgE
VSGTPTSLILKFDSSGTLISPTAAALPKITIPTTGGITPDIVATLDIIKVTQFASSSAVIGITQNGYTAGDLTGVSIDQKGILTTTYLNGQTQRLAQISLADFRNPQGLAPISGGAWVETFTSGQAIQGKPLEGKFGELRPGALEESNVDLTAELVAMMTAQRSYQANVQTIKTQDQVVQALVNLR